MREQRREVSDTLLAETAHFQWIPGLGAFVEGYSLIVSKWHRLNTGSFDHAIIDELEDLIAQVRRCLNRLYSRSSVVFEHGSMGTLDAAGGCIDHHHVHIMPAELPVVPEVLSSNFVNQGPIRSMRELTRFSEKRIPYIYYVTTTGKQHVFRVEVLPRQYLRQVVAAECGCPQDWDWRRKPFLENIGAFVGKARHLGIGGGNAQDISR